MFQFFIAQVFVHWQGRMEHTDICTESHPAAHAAPPFEQELFSLFSNACWTHSRYSPLEVAICQKEAGHVVGRRVGEESIVLRNK